MLNNFPFYFNCTDILLKLNQTMAASYHSNNKETQKTATVEDSYFKDKLAQLEEQVKRVMINKMDKRRENIL